MKPIELKFGESTITLIPEQTKGMWTIPGQIQIENTNADSDAYADIDRDAIDQLIGALETLRKPYHE